MAKTAKKKGKRGAGGGRVTPKGTRPANFREKDAGGCCDSCEPPRQLN